MKVKSQNERSFVTQYSGENVSELEHLPSTSGGYKLVEPLRKQFGIPVYSIVLLALQKAEFKEFKEIINYLFCISACTEFYFRVTN